MSQEVRACTYNAELKGENPVVPSQHALHRAGDDEQVVELLLHRAECLGGARKAHQGNARGERGGEGSR